MNPTHLTLTELESRLVAQGYVLAELDRDNPYASTLDFDSDEPLPVCPMRNNGDDICESCQ